MKKIKNENKIRMVSFGNKFKQTVVHKRESETENMGK